MRFYPSTSLLLCTALALSAFGAPTQHLEKLTSPDIVARLSQAEYVSLVKVTPRRQPPFSAIGSPKNLSAEQIKQLQALLLNDDHYSFNDIKRCLFIPEISYQFAGENTIDIFVSFSCQKIKILSELGETVIDYDPMAEKFNAFSQSLFATPSFKKST